MNLNLFLEKNEKITSYSLYEFDVYIKTLEQHKEMAAKTSKFDWQSELIVSIIHCQTIKNCLILFNHKNGVRSESAQVDMTELETKLKLKGIDTETFYKNWKETGKFL